MSASFSLATVRTKAATAVAILIDDQLLGLTAAEAAFRDAQPRSSSLTATSGVLQLLEDWDRNFDCLREIAQMVADGGGDDERFAHARLDAATVQMLPPVPRPGKMLYAAQNFPEHVAEMRAARASGFNDAPIDEARDFTGDRQTTRPYLFLKAPSSLTGANDEIAIPESGAKVDWEVELALAIGRPGREIRADRAHEHIAGFMATNDLTRRDLLFRPDRERLRSDWLAAKSHDGFAPMGPVLVPREFVADHHDLTMRLLVNGDLRQLGNTGDLIFSPEEQIEYASRLMTVRSGDVFATGTCGGVGQASETFLAPGDLVQAEIVGVGQLRNQLIATHANAEVPT